MARAHAKLAPSACSRWSVCTAAPTLEEGYPDTTSVYATEGTLAHKLGELLLQKHFYFMKQASFDRQLKAIQADEQYTKAMLSHCEDYRDFIAEQAAEMGDPIVALEERVDISHIVPEGFGSCDCILIADGLLHVIDLKYGAGVPVDSKDNPQLQLYALGALELFGAIYDVDRVKMTIFQPRLDNIATYELPVKALEGWATWLKPIAQEAFDGPGTFRAGEEQCRFCKAHNDCRARADYNLELAKYDFAPADKLSLDEVADILGRLSEFKRWATDISDWALEQVRDHELTLPGWKLVEGRSNRTYTDKDEALQKLLEDGFDKEVITKTELLTITAMEKVLGKKQFSEVLKDFIIKPPGKPVLAPEEDKRPEINSIEETKKDFI